jgi:hypothetical protein
MALPTFEGVGLSLPQPEAAAMRRRLEARIRFMFNPFVCEEFPALVWKSGPVNPEREFV